MAMPAPQPVTAGKLCQSSELHGSSRQGKANSKQSSQSQDLSELVRRPWHGRRQEAASENAFRRGFDPPITRIPPGFVGEIVFFFIVAFARAHRSRAQPSSSYGCTLGRGWL